MGSAEGDLQHCLRGKRFCPLPCKVLEITFKPGCMRARYKRSLLIRLPIAGPRIHLHVHALSTKVKKTCIFQVLGSKIVLYVRNMLTYVQCQVQTQPINHVAPHFS